MSSCNSQNESYRGGTFLCPASLSLDANALRASSLRRLGSDWYRREKWKGMNRATCARRAINSACVAFPDASAPGQEVHSFGRPANKGFKELRLSPSVRQFLFGSNGPIILSAMERLLRRFTLVIVAQLALEPVFELAYISGQSVPGLLDDLAQVAVQLIQSCGDPSVALLLLSFKL